MGNVHTAEEVERVGEQAGARPDRGRKGGLGREGGREGERGILMS